MSHAREFPVAHDALPRDFQHFGGFLDAQAAEEPQFHDFGLAGIESRQRFERLVQIHQSAVRFGQGVDGFVQIQPHHSAPALAGSAGPGRIHEDTPHHLGGDGEEMGPVLPAYTGDIHQMQEGFVNQGGRLQCVPLVFLLHVAPGHAAQLSVDERCQLLQRGEVAAAPGSQ
jgi:hypothetical protein